MKPRAAIIKGSEHQESQMPGVTGPSVVADRRTAGLGCLVFTAAFAWSLVMEKAFGQTAGEHPDTPRVWTHMSGYSLTAAFGGVEKDVVTLLQPGKPRAWAPLKLLSPESRHTALYLDRCGVLGRRVIMRWVTVGNPGNSGNSVSWGGADGAVSYVFDIGMYEVTNAQYWAFLNSVDPAGVNPHKIYDELMTTDREGGILFDTGAPQGRKYSLKPNMGDKPVGRINYERAMRFANWLNNDQNGTDTGAYDFTKLVDLPARHLPSAKVWIPTMNEWLKAAYYTPKLEKGKAGYYQFATQSNNQPVKAIATPTGEVENAGPRVVNYDNGAVWNGSANLTSVGATGAASYYGTFDQDGNAEEWMEPDRDGKHLSLASSYRSTSAGLPSGMTSVMPVTKMLADLGFRLAAVHPKGTNRPLGGKR